jgi:hypothetical protein
MRHDFRMAGAAKWEQLGCVCRTENWELRTEN